MTRKVLVTGGAGFIGSHLVDVLLTAGDDVHVLDDLSKGQVTNLPERVPLHVVDIASERVDRVFADAHFDAVVHCAAQTNVMRSVADPELDRRINVEGLQRVLDAAVKHGVSRFVFVSSGGAVYGETPTPANEATPPRPDNPYGRHKLEGEAIVAAAPISAASLRLSNVYGPRQRSDAEGGVISIFTERLAARQQLTIYGDGEQQRDFVHVADVVAAMMLALGDPSMRGAWNVGTGTPTTINEVAQLMQRAFDSTAPVERLEARGEVRRSCLDIAKLRATGRWQPQYSLAAGIAQIAETMAPARR